MGKLAQITEEEFNGKAHSSAIVKLINPKNVIDVQDVNSKGRISYEKRRSIKPQIRITTENTAALIVLFDTAITSTTSGVTQLDVTVKRQNGVLFGTAKPMSLAIENVVEIQADKDDVNDSRIEYNDSSIKTGIYIVDETVAALLTQANA